MSNPETAATQEGQTPTDAAPTLEEVQQQADMSEKRRKDTQAAYTKTQQRLKELEAKNDVLMQAVSPNINLTPDQKDELDDLMSTNPQEWRRKMNELETNARNSIDTQLNEAATRASNESIKEYRQRVLDEYNESHPGFEITDSVVENDVPPRITKKLADGSISFEDYLNEVHTYLNKGKVVKSQTTMEQPDLGKVAGGNTPSGDKTEELVYKDVLL